MIFFPKKYPVLFISKHFIDPGQVTVGKQVSFDGFEALAYTEDTLADVLRQIQILFRKNIRVVLSEELVYVTGLSFSPGTPLTRELVRHAMEEAIPEDLQATAWDFRTLHYTKKQETDTEILVQAAVVEGKFFHILARALEGVVLPIESIMPESYVLAQMVAGHDGASLLVVRDRESTLLSVVENGFVIASRVDRKGADLADIERFLSFVAVHKSRKVIRVIFSHFTREEMMAFQKLATDGYELIQEDYNPLIGVARETHIKGKDEEVLNLSAFLFSRETSLWRRFFKKQH